MTDDTTTETNPGVDRRSVLLGAGGVVLAGSAAGATTVLADEEKHDDDDADRDGLSLQFGDELRSEAFVLDTDMDGRLTNAMRVAADPAGGDRDRVVHVTSANEETSDYVVSGIDLREAALSVGEAADADITYDYYKGSEVTNRVPDEVMVLLRTGTTEFAIAVRGADANEIETWETRNVSDELTDDWQAVDVDVRELELDAIRRVAASGDVDDVEALLREFSVADEIETVTDLTSSYGDAEMLAMAIGNGALDGAATDAYYANLQIGGEERRIPAVTPMDVTFSGSQGRGGGNRVTASLSLRADGSPESDQTGVSPADVDLETVRLAPYANVAPPLPIVGRRAAVAPESADVSADRIDLEFVPGRVRQAVARSDDGRVVVYGDFEGDEPDTFAAVGTVEGPGRGN